MPTADEGLSDIAWDSGMRTVLLHVGGVGGGNALVMCAQSWYAEPLQNSLLLSGLGLACWIVTIGSLSWTMWEFIVPSFVSARP